MSSKDIDEFYVSTSMYFLTHNDLFTTEKPYAFRFALTDHDMPANIPQTNMKMERKDDIIIRNIRGHEKQFTLEKNGFEVLSHTSQIAYEDFYKQDRVKIYLQELEGLLKDRLKASHVQVFRYGVSVYLPGTYRILRSPWLSN
jgi:hypothetical protein